MSKKFAFEKLAVWQKSVEMVKDVYAVTKTFPKEEKYGIISQIRRSALSVSCNFAEGSGKITNKDKANYTTIAYGSLMETMNLLILGVEVEMMHKEKLEKFREQISEISRMLTALRSSQLK
jgi:four helix bundle protein